LKRLRASPPRAAAPGPVSTAPGATSDAHPTARSQSGGGRRKAGAPYFRLPPSAFRLLHLRYLVFQQTYDPDWLAFSSILLRRAFTPSAGEPPRISIVAPAG